jgi:proteic killer suppression protein
LLRLETEATYTAGFAPEIVKAFRKRIQYIHSAPDEQSLRSWRSLHLEKLKGKRAHQWSIRLNDQWRLILEFRQDETGKYVAVVSIEDYH